MAKEATHEDIKCAEATEVAALTFRYRAAKACRENREATFGTRLVAAREARGMTQAALCKASGLPPSQVCNYEKDRKMPGVAKLVTLSDALGVPVGLLCGADE